MKIAVVGAGIFGTTIAWMLGKNGFSVDLYEKREGILLAASGINQYRLHRGYHYPRSKETMLTCLHGEREFAQIYTEAILDEEIEHFYCVASKGSFLTPEQCMRIWNEVGLRYTLSPLDIINPSRISASFKVSEYLFDPEALKKLCRFKLEKYNINVLLNTEFRESNFSEYDLVVISTYSINNSLLSKFPNVQRDFQFEICEKLTLKLPEKYNKKSVVVIDGPFMCIDPFGRTGNFAMGNVVHAIHTQNIGKLPEIPERFKGLLNSGVVRNPPITNYEKFINSAKEFFPGIEDAEHIGSMFTIRTVLPYHEHDDARPTIVEQVSDKIVTVFSGKIPTCIDAANQVLRIAKEVHN